MTKSKCYTRLCFEESTVELIFHRSVPAKMPRKHNPDQMQLSICAAGFCMVKWRRHLWDEQNHQGDVDREDDGQRSKRE